MNTLKSFSFKNTDDAFSMLPLRPERSNKRDFGRVLAVCGSYGMAGAAFFAAKAAYRMGAGLVEIFTHESNRIILQTLIPEAIISTYTDSYDSDSLLRSIERADCIVAGCGLGITTLSLTLISELLHTVDAKKTPLILDADALNLISRNPSLLKHTRHSIITPHVKEMERLCKKGTDEILSSVTEIAYDFAKKNSVICVLKDHKTVVSNGTDKIYLNTTGNSGMATGGSGDALAGILAGLLAQRKNSGASVYELTTLGVYIHGLAGDTAARTLSEYSIMATDIIEALPGILKNQSLYQSFSVVNSKKY